MEGRELAKGKAVEHPRGRTQRRETLQRARDRIRQAARRDRAMRWTALWHQVDDIDRRREAYDGRHREAAPGVDGRTWAAYGEAREAHLRELSDRLTRGAYHAPPVERVYIPQPAGRQRPRGIPTVAGLNALSAGDFRGFAEGFRLGRSPHDALDAAAVGIETRHVNGGLEADLRGCCEAMDHAWLVQGIAHRMGDQRVVRHVQTWLKAGVREEGQWRVQEAGTPQGGHVSPLAANLSRQDVLAGWAERWRRR